MAQRTEAICDGKTIGIESIFTVINDKQINIPDKLNWLREKSRHHERRSRRSIPRMADEDTEQTGLLPSNIY